MPSRLGLYKRSPIDDEHPLPINDDENGGIEMEDFGENEPHNEFSQEVTPRIIYKKRRREFYYLLWAIISTIFLLTIFIIAIQVHSSKRNLKWCVIGDEEAKKCLQMSKSFSMEQFRPFVTCVNSSSFEDCIIKIDSDIADVVALPNLYLYKNQRILQPVMSQDYQSTAGTHKSYFVAVVKKSDSSVNLTQKGLTNRTICSTDIDLISGYLYDKKVITRRFCDTSQAKTSDWNLCPTQQNGDCIKINSGIDNWKSNQSIIQCMFTGDPFVAFLDHLTMLSTSKSLDDQTFELLCPNGSRASLHDYKSCHLFLQPSNSLVVSSKIRFGVDLDVPTNIVELLHVAQLYFGSHSHQNFNMFVSESGFSNVLFKDDTRKLDPLLINCTAVNYLGVHYMSYMANYNCQELDHNKTFKTCFLPQYTNPIP